MMNIAPSSLTKHALTSLGNSRGGSSSNNNTRDNSLNNNNTSSGNATPAHASAVAGPSKTPEFAARESTEGGGGGGGPINLQDMTRAALDSPSAPLTYAGRSLASDADTMTRMLCVGLVRGWADADG
eukprot:2132013-Rhodomonas_salina.1